jgi:hypothetical protein
MRAPKATRIFEGFRRQSPRSLGELNSGSMGIPVQQKSRASPGLSATLYKENTKFFVFDAAPQTRARQPHTV